MASVIGAQAIKQLGDEIKKISTSSDKLRGSLTLGATALKAFATVQVAQSVSGMVTSNINLADSLNDLRQRTGVAVEQLAKYKVAAELSGTSLETVAGSFNKLNKNLVDALDGTGPAANAFKAMGIDIMGVNGELKNADVITKEIAELFKRFPDGPQKAALAMAVFGKQGAELIPLLNEGAESIEKMSLNIDQNFATAADAFNDKMGIMKANVLQFKLDITKEMLPAVSDAADKLNELFSDKEAVKAWGEVLGGVLYGLAGLAKGLFSGLADIQSIFSATAAEAEHLYYNDKASMLKSVIADEKLRGRLKSDETKTFESQLASSNQARSMLSAYLKNGGQISEADTAGPYKKDFDADRAAKKLRDEELKKLLAGRGGGGSSAERGQRRADEFLAKQREGLETLKQEAIYIGKTSIEIQKLKDAREFETEVAERAVSLKGASLEKFKAETEQIKLVRQELLQLNYEKSREFGTGVENFFAKFQEDATNAAKNVEDVLTNAFSGAENAFVEFTKTGKFNFKDLAASILEDIVRIQFRSAISGIFGGIFGKGGSGLSLFSGFADGGVMSNQGALQLRKYASGGIAHSPQLAMFGEGSMPEAYVPLPDHRTIPVTLTGGGKGGGVVNNVSVSVNMSGGDQVKSDSSQGSQIGKLIAATVKATLIDESRPGGLLAK